MLSLRRNRECGEFRRETSQHRRAIVIPSTLSTRYKKLNLTQHRLALFISHPITDGDADGRFYDD